MAIFSSEKKDKNTIRKLDKKIRKSLDKDRYYHSRGVCYTAAALAMCHDENITDAMIAGILHDCAKRYDNMQLLAMCDKYGILPTEAERINPTLLHARVGSALAKAKYGVKKPVILDAISRHTTGCPDMTKLDKIIYIADYIEPGRKIIPNLDNIRKLAFINLDKCIVEICSSTISYLNEKGMAIDDTTLKTLEFYSIQQK